MPFREELARGRKRNIVLQMRGPKDKQKLARFKKALAALARKHGATIKKKGGS